MAGKKLLLCNCPDARVNLERLRSRLTAQGLETCLLEPCCTPAGLSRLRQLLTDKPADYLLAACGPQLSHQFFRLLSELPVPVVDLWRWPDEAAAVAEIFWALEATPPSPPVREVIPAALVLGGGVGGVQTALDLAYAGLKVYLVEESPTIGGTMAQLDKTFPTLDCSICILGPKLVEAAGHPLIEILTQALVTEITGQAGNFTVHLTLQPRYVDLSRCVGCGNCAEVCPVFLPSRWNLGLSPRKCIRIIFAQAVPLRSILEKEYCIDCRLCVQACGRQAINLEDTARDLQLQVGAIVLATGAVPFNPQIKGEYNYGRLPTVLTNLEFERLVCASGPTTGRLITPDGRPVKSIAFLQCVGSRDRRFLPYCSGFCCTASIKEAMLALEHDPEIEVTIFFNDIRTSGKGYEELYRRAQEAGVRFVKALPGRIEAGAAGRPVIVYEDLHRGQQCLTVDLAVLAVGLTGRVAAPPFRGESLPRDDQGFFQPQHPVLHPVEASRPGVFLVGTCLGPQDITETVCQASAAAGRVLRLLQELSSRSAGT